MTRLALRAALGRQNHLYDRFDLEPIGTTGLINIDHRHGTATFGIMLGERRGQGLGTETTRLVLDWAFTVLGCTTWT